MRLRGASVLCVAVMVVVALLQLAIRRHEGLAEARSLKKAHTTTTTTTTTVRPENTGASRIEGGTIRENVPSWLGTIWARDDVTPDDGRLLGHAISLPDHHLLMHNTAGRHIYKPMPEFRNDTLLPIPTPGDDVISTYIFGKPERVAFPTPAKFDIEQFRPHFGNARLDIKDYGIADSQFDLIKVERDWLHPHALDKFDAPVLERDPKQLGGDDCRAYGWSTKLYDQGGSRQGEQGEEADVLPKNRTFVDFPVIAPKPGMCDRYGSCRLVAKTQNPYDKALLCGGFNEEGMPVVCGKEKKLTYLLQASSPKLDPAGCGEDFRGFHVANIAKELDRHIGKPISG